MGSGTAGEAPGPWSLALRRFLGNRVAVAFLGLFVAIIAFVLAAPLWADNVAHTGPNKTHVLEKLTVDGEKREVVTPQGQPIGPQWFEAGGRFFLGADSRLGRDEMVRLMYGGRTSVFIGIVSGLITTILAVVLGLLAGFYRGWVDALIARTMDVLWSLPVFVIGVAAGISLAVGGLKIGPLELQSGSIWAPILIISIFSLPYIGRPVRITCTTSVCESSDSTNQPVWNTPACAGEFAPNTNQSSANVA